MVASLWSGTWFASQLPLNQIEATASKCAKDTLRHLRHHAEPRNFKKLAEVIPAFSQH
jgi:hypothetical protein